MNTQTPTKHFARNPLKVWEMYNDMWLENFNLKEIPIPEMVTYIKKRSLQICNVGLKHF